MFHGMWKQVIGESCLLSVNVRAIDGIVNVAVARTLEDLLVGPLVLVSGRTGREVDAGVERVCRVRRMGWVSRRSLCGHRREANYAVWSPKLTSVLDEL